MIPIILIALCASAVIFLVYVLPFGPENDRSKMTEIEIADDDKALNAFLDRW